MIKIDNLSKVYKKKVLDNISLEIQGNKIVGLLGKNQSGKTTLLKILASIVKPTSGEIHIFNEELGYKSREIVSYIISENMMFKNMNIKDILAFYRDFFWDFNEGSAKTMFAELNIDLNSKVETLSKGTIEKLNIVLTFSRKSKVYLLDEPLGRIDIGDRRKVIDIILDNFQEGSILIISSSLVAEIEDILDEVIFIKDGEVLIHNSIENLKEQGMSSLVDLFKEENNETYI